MLFAMSSLATLSCSSVIDTDKIGSIAQLTTWKYEATLIAQENVDSKETKARYEAARKEIKAWTHGVLKLEVDDAESSWFKKVDLSEDRIPLKVRSSVNAFIQDGATGINNITAFKVHSGSIGNELVVPILDWVSKVQQEKRSRSADSLRSMLKELVWDPWEKLNP